MTKIEIFLNKLKNSDSNFLIQQNSSFRLAKLLKQMFPKGKIVQSKETGSFCFLLDNKIYNSDGEEKIQDIENYKEVSKELMEIEDQKSREYYELLDKIEEE